MIPDLNQPRGIRARQPRILRINRDRSNRILVVKLLAHVKSDDSMGLPNDLIFHHIFVVQGT